MRSNDGFAGTRFQRLPRNACDLAALAGDLLVFRKGFRRFGLGNILCGCFRQHVEHNFRGAHVVAQVFLFEPLEPLVLPGVHSRPCAGDLVGENGILDAFFYAARLPLIRQLPAHLNGLQALVDPFTGISLAQIGFQRALNAQLRVDGFLDALPAHLRQPQLEGFGLGRGDGLDDAQKLPGIGCVGLIIFPVGGTHFQLTTICSQLAAFFLKTAFQHAPILSWIGTVRKRAYHIHDGEIPFLALLIPQAANGSLLKAFDDAVGFVGHVFSPLLPLNWLHYTVFAPTRQPRGRRTASRAVLPKAVTCASCACTHRHR